MTDTTKPNDWTRPAAMAIPKGGYLPGKAEQGRYGPIFPRTPANYGFTIIAKLIPGREEAVRQYGQKIQDAVAAANQLAEPLARGAVSPLVLARIQARRELPTRLTQAVQVFLQNRILRPALHANQGHNATWPAALFQRLPVLRRVPARLFGMGFLPEHVRLPAAHIP